MSQSSEHTCSAEQGLELTCSTRGAAITRLRVPYEGEFLDTVLSYSDPLLYENDAFYLGAMCGRYTGRIRNASFMLNNQAYAIEIPSDSKHALHGGTEGFDQRQWTLDKPSCSSDEHSAASMAFSLHSPDGDQGFPGNLDARVIYRIVGPGTLVIDVEAVCDQDTVLNLVNHAYFNLNQDGSAIDNHRLQVVADAVTETDQEGLPTGRLVAIQDGPLDLYSDRGSMHWALSDRDRLGERAFDHNYVLSKTPGKLGLAAIVSTPDHALSLAVHTTLPGLQCYTGDQLHGDVAARSGLCLEAQQFPDAPNQPGFPSAVLTQGKVFRARTVYAFGALDDIADVRNMPFYAVFE